MSTDHQIVILGAGYAGVLCALRLARKARRLGAGVTLVAPASHFTQRVRLHQLATGQPVAGPGIADLLAGTGVSYLCDAAVAIDPDHGRVTLAGGSTVDYNTLVYAVGARADSGAVAGVDRYAATLDTADTAREVAQRLARLAARGAPVRTGGPAGGDRSDGDGVMAGAGAAVGTGATAVIDPAGGRPTVVVCGGGLTGIEAATEIAERYPTLHTVLVSRGEPGALMGQRARAHLRRVLDRLGVTVRAGTPVTEVTADAVELADGTRIAAEMCLWTAGVRVPDLAARAGVATDRHGRVVVDPTLLSVSHPGIYAIGDAAAVRQSWGQLHGTCQSGLPTAAYAAAAIASRLRGRTPRPFRFGYVHQPVSLGRRDAVIQFTRADNSPRRWHLSGRLAAAYKAAVTATPLPALRLNRRLPVPVALWQGGRASRPTGRADR